MLENAQELFIYLSGKMTEVEKALSPYSLKLRFTEPGDGSLLSFLVNEDGLSLEIGGLRYREGDQEKAFIEIRFYSEKWKKGFTYSLSSFYRHEECQDLYLSLPISEDRADDVIKKILFLLERDAKSILIGDDFEKTIYDPRLWY